MRWLGNIVDPTLRTAEIANVRATSGTKRDEAARRHREWLTDKIIGEPQATAAHSVEELKAMGVVGVYADEPEAA